MEISDGFKIIFMLLIIVALAMINENIKDIKGMMKENIEKVEVEKVTQVTAEYVIIEKGGNWDVVVDKKGKKK